MSSPYTVLVALVLLGCLYIDVSEAKADQQQAQIKLPGVKKKVESARNALEPIQVDTDIFVELRNLEGAFYQEHRENLQVN